MDLYKIVTLLFILIFGSALLAKVYEVGPIIWLKRASRRQRALEGTDRRELVARVPRPMTATWCSPFTGRVPPAAAASLPS